MGFSVWQLLIILAIVLLLFGAKRLRNLGSDLGTSVRGFKDAMRDENKDEDADTAAGGDGSTAAPPPASASLQNKDGLIDGEVVKQKDKV